MQKRKPCSPLPDFEGTPPAPTNIRDGEYYIFLRSRTNNIAEMQGSYWSNPEKLEIWVDPDAYLADLGLTLECAGDSASVSIFRTSDDLAPVAGQLAVGVE